MRKSIFSIKKGDDERFPYVVVMQGIGMTKYTTKKEALKVLKKARIKERLMIKQLKR